MRQRVQVFAAAAVAPFLLLPYGRAAGAEGAERTAAPTGLDLTAALAAWLEAVPRASWYWVAAGLAVSALAGALAVPLMSRRRDLRRMAAGRVVGPAVPAAVAPAAAQEANRWELTGWDAAGSSICARFGPLDLARAGDGLVFGRNAGLCHFVVRNKSVSRRHVRFTIRDGQLMVEDLNSANGTLLERRRLQPMKPAPLHDGDTLVLGDFLLRLTDHA